MMDGRSGNKFGRSMHPKNSTVMRCAQQCHLTVPCPGGTDTFFLSEIRKVPEERMLVYRALHICKSRKGIWNGRPLHFLRFHQKVTKVSRILLNPNTPDD